MDYFFALKYAHIIAFVYWLGGDLGTFFASRHVVRSDIGVEARQVALKIMLACDQGPRLAMPAIFALGYQMAVAMQLLAAPAWVSALVWLACLYWFSNVLVLYFNEGKSFTGRLSQIDFGFRLLVIALLVGAALHGLTGGGWLVADWVAWKMLVFAALVGCGVMIRLNLKPFVPAFVSLVSEGPSEQANAVLAQSVNRCRPWVWAIWLGLFLNAAIGVHLL
jgi:hypothetical protein